MPGNCDRGTAGLAKCIVAASASRDIQLITIAFKYFFNSLKRTSFDKVHILAKSLSHFDMVHSSFYYMWCYIWCQHRNGRRFLDEKKKQRKIRHFRFWARIKGKPAGQARNSAAIHFAESLHTGTGQNRRSAGRAQGLWPFASRLSPHIRKASKPDENEFPSGPEAFRLPGS